MNDYVELTQFIASHIVGDPDALDIEQNQGSRNIVVTITCAQEDMGKLIGKRGRNIEAIRAVVRAAGLRQHERVQVELAEDEDYEDASLADQSSGEAGYKDGSATDNELSENDEPKVVTEGSFTD